MTAARNVGIIGLGMIGGGIATCLRDTPNKLAVFDTRAAAAHPFRDRAVVCGSAGEVAAQSDVILVAVVDAEQVRAVLAGPNGILEAAKPGTIVVLLSTLTVRDIHVFGDLASRAGVTLVDCGVTGGGAAAKRGLTCLVGGDNATVDELRPVLDGFSPLVLHMGPLGSGMAAKLARNVIVYGVWRAVYEGGLLAEAANVDLKALVSAVEASEKAGVSSVQWLRRGTVQPLSKITDERASQLAHVLNLWRKDLAAAEALALDLGVALPLAQIARESAATIIGVKDEFQ